MGSSGEEAKRKKDLEEKQKQLAEKKEKGEEVEGEKKDETMEGGEKTEAKMEVDEVKEEVKEEDKTEEVEMETEPPVVELTEVEKKQYFKSPAGSTDFTRPDKGEGFDDIKYEWQNAMKSKDYLRSWV